MQIVQGNRVIDTSTGETVEEIEQVRDLVLENRNDPIMELIIKSGSTPIHVTKAKELQVPAHVVSTYVGSAPDSPNSYLGQRIGITGCIVYYSGKFTPKVTDPNAPGYKTGEGFYTFLMKTDRTRPFEFRVGDRIIKKQIPVILKCDGVKIRETLIGLIDSYGWFDFKNPIDNTPVTVPVVFTREGTNNSFFMQILPEDISEE